MFSTAYLIHRKNCFVKNCRVLYVFEKRNLLLLFLFLNKSKVALRNLVKVLDKKKKKIILLFLLIFRQHQQQNSGNFICSTSFECEAMTTIFHPSTTFRHKQNTTVRALTFLMLQLRGDCTNCLLLFFCEFCVSSLQVLPDDVIIRSCCVWHEVKSYFVARKFSKRKRIIVIHKVPNFELSWYLSFKKFLSKTKDFGTRGKIFQGRYEVIQDGWEICMNKTFTMN